jgi:hypothetical protein
MKPAKFQTSIPLVMEILEPHREKLGSDFVSYAHHCYRVAHFCLAFSRDHPIPEKIFIASAFHDLGIWTEKTFDYLGFSEELAGRYLAAKGKAEWSEEIVSMIENHHKITPYRGESAWLTESFRKADWVDITLGCWRFGLARSFIKEVRDAFPNAGFHRKLVRLTQARLMTHPLSPLPMLRW